MLSRVVCSRRKADLQGLRDRDRDRDGDIARRVGLRCRQSLHPQARLNLHDGAMRDALRLYVRRPVALCLSPAIYARVTIYSQSTSDISALAVGWRPQWVEQGLTAPVDQMIEWAECQRELNSESSRVRMAKRGDMGRHTHPSLMLLQQAQGARAYSL